MGNKRVTNYMFLNRVWKNNKYYRNGDFKIISKYEKQSKLLIVETKYGLCKVYSSNLQKGFMPSICTAIDKKEYLQNKLNETNEEFKLGNIEIIGEVKNTKEKKRFISTHMPYKYEIIKIFEGEAREMCELELRLKNLNKLNKYKPIIDFNGSSECFKTIKTL